MSGAAVCYLALHLANRFFTEKSRRTLEASDSIEQFARIQLAERAGVAFTAAEGLFSTIGSDHIITVADDDYPALLRETSHAPYAFFARGNRALLAQPSISMVGTREPSLAGRRAAAQLAESFAAEGLTVVSGIARGIDAVSHHAALACAGSTIAVLPNGFEHLYPLENRDIYHLASSSESILLLSEYEPKQKPMKHHFVRRNRIIAGLSETTVFVEGSEKSGAMITANSALAEGRDVAAISHTSLARNTGGLKLIADGAIDLTERAMSFHTVRVLP